MGTACDVKGSHPIERHIAELLGKKRVLAKKLRMFIGEAGQTAADEVEPFPNLRTATKRVMLSWIAGDCPELGEYFTLSLQTNGRFPMRMSQKEW
jgi:hypothetical protein